MSEGSATLNPRSILENEISRTEERRRLNYSEATSGHKTMTNDLHRLASLIYTNRAIHHISSNAYHQQRLVREAFLILAQMETCQSAWPLFIVACEAANDEQRLLVMNVFDATLQDCRRNVSHIRLIQQLVEAVWKQHDLDTEGQIGHISILDAVISSVPFIPPFA